MLNRSSMEELLQDLAGCGDISESLYRLGKLEPGDYTRALALLEGDDGTVEAAIAVTRRQLCDNLSSSLQVPVPPSDFHKVFGLEHFEAGRARAYFLLFVAWVNDNRGMSIVSEKDRERADDWLRKKGVDAVLNELYRPTDDSGCFSRKAWSAAKPIGDRLPVETPMQFWDQLNLAKPSFWAFGTTSYVLCVQASGLPTDHDEIALKCLGFRFGESASHIRAEARDAAGVFDAEPRAALHLPAVYASTTKWVAMEFVDGPTLAEWVTKWSNACAHAAPAKRHSNSDDPRSPLWPGADVVEAVGGRLASVICGLHNLRLTHGDLQPKNVIINGPLSDLLPEDTEAPFDDEGKFVALRPHFRLRLVDRGRNFASMKLVTAVDSDVAWFEPPESDQSALPPRIPPHDDPFGDSVAAQPDPAYDFFGLGRLIEYLLEGGRFEGRELIPLTIYTRFPLVSRLLDDLLDPEPSDRLALTSGAADPFERLEGFDAALKESVTTERKLGIVSHQLPPPQRRLDKVVAKYRILLNAFGLRDITLRLVLEAFPRRSSPGAARKVNWLAIFALVSILGFAASLMVTLGGLAADYSHRSSLPGLDAMLSFLASVTLAHVLRPGAPLGHTAHNNPAHIVGFSYAVAGFGYYQIIFAAAASNAPRSPGRWSRVFRVFLRSWCLLPTATILIANMFWPELWLYFAGIGGVLVCAMNFSCGRFERQIWDRILQQLGGPDASEHGTPRPAQAKMDREARAYRRERDFLANWKVSSLGYCVAILGLAVGITTHRLHDTVVYEAVILGANLLLLYRDAIVRFGPELRGRLCRAFVLEERANLQTKQERSKRKD